jgi:hypothetical protein
VVIAVLCGLDEELALGFHVFDLTVRFIVDRVQGEEVDWFSDFFLLAELELEETLSYLGLHVYCLDCCRTRKLWGLRVAETDSSNYINYMELQGAVKGV